ncbi:mitochondrial-processing peptidase subunit alpha-like [Phalaenopsis equestris]|uniref:mitochondrial-processing peptidase subunit alpha-like n=1 Tax=Phalaenopsis equestris TaxID=78828 RepID=UPI0009E1EC17|nr:mitochondrial-processing peptidase subunit alpha-like [Phalaenopsis equestris]
MFASAERFASTSVAKRSPGGFFSWLTGAKSSQVPPLDFPLPGVRLPPPLPDYVEPGNTRITTLPNGVKIASETSPNPAASIGLYVDSGSIYETPDSFGTTQLLERMAFKSTTNRSHLRIVREVEAIGGNVSASASREQMGYTCDALKTYVPQMVELLIDSVRNAVFLDWEVNEQVSKLKAETVEASSNPQALLLEAIHSAGYSGALAIPLIASESTLNNLNGSILEQFLVENYTAPRIVLAASGVEHEELVKIAEPLLSDLSKTARPEEPKSVYVGGEYRRQADVTVAHLALAFEVPGGWHKEKDVMAVTVLQMLLGGGGSFSAGGPGKGMYSRLYRNVLNEFQQIQSFSAFNSIYNNSGIFGIHATTVDWRHAYYMELLPYMEMYSVINMDNLKPIGLTMFYVEPKEGNLLRMRVSKVSCTPFLQLLALVLTTVFFDCCSLCLFGSILRPSRYHYESWRGDVLMTKFLVFFIPRIEKLSVVDTEFSLERKNVYCLHRMPGLQAGMRLLPRPRCVPEGGRRCCLGESNCKSEGLQAA